jgi:hypothetical protein
LPSKAGYRLRKTRQPYLWHYRDDQHAHCPLTNLVRRFGAALHGLFRRAGALDSRALGRLTKDTKSYLWLLLLRSAQPVCLSPIGAPRRAAFHGLSCSAGALTLCALRELAKDTNSYLGVIPVYRTTDSGHSRDSSTRRRQRLVSLAFSRDQRSASAVHHFMRRAGPLFTVCPVRRVRSNSHAHSEFVTD